MKNEFKVVETDFGANKYSSMFDELDENIYDFDSDDIEDVIRKYNFPGEIDMMLKDMSKYKEINNI